MAYISKKSTEIDFRDSGVAQELLQQDERVIFEKRTCKMRFIYTFLYHIVLVLESIFIGWYIVGIVVPARLTEESYIAQEKLEGFLDKVQPMKDVLDFVRGRFGSKEATDGTTDGKEDGGFEFNLPDFSELLPALNSRRRRKRQLPAFLENLGLPKLSVSPPKLPEREDILETFYDIRQFNRKTIITSAVLVGGQLVALSAFAVGRGTKAVWLFPLFLLWSVASTAYLDFVCIRELNHDFTNDTRLIKVPPPESRVKVERSITIFMGLRTSVTLIGLVVSILLIYVLKRSKRTSYGGVAVNGKA